MLGKKIFFPASRTEWVIVCSIAFDTNSQIGENFLKLVLAFNGGRSSERALMVIHYVTGCMINENGTTNKALVICFLSFHVQQATFDGGHGMITGDMVSWC